MSFYLLYFVGESLFEEGECSILTSVYKVFFLFINHPLSLSLSPSLSFAHILFRAETWTKNTVKGLTRNA